MDILKVPIHVLHLAFAIQHAEAVQRKMTRLNVKVAVRLFSHTQQLPLQEFLVNAPLLQTTRIISYTQ